MTTSYQPMTTATRTATISECGKYRYHLSRVWGVGKRILYVMLNPSTADGDCDDPTIRKCVGFAKQLGYKGIDVVNLYAYRATSPKDLRAAGYPVGPLNDDWIMAQAAGVMGNGLVVLAWGGKVELRSSRPYAVVRMLLNEGCALHALRRNADGHPAHPLMLPYSCAPSPYRHIGCLLHAST